MINSLKEAAANIRRLVEKHDAFVRKYVGIIKRRTLDSHFLVRSVESGFSYRSKLAVRRGPSQRGHIS